MLYQAHRGVQNEFPENTMPSYIAAKEQGYHVIECDARCTKDGVWVMHHDAKVGRTCRASDGSPLTEQTPISEITYDELRTFDAGLWKGERFRGTHVPTLKQLLDFSREENIPIKIDNIFANQLKEHQAILFQEVMESKAPVGFTCANIKTIENVLNAVPDAEIHYDGSVTEEILPQIVKVCGSNALTIWIPVDCERTSWCKMPKASKELCDLTKRYARLGLWIIDTEEELSLAERLGADIIETMGSLKPKTACTDEKRIWQ